MKLVAVFVAAAALVLGVRWVLSTDGEVGGGWAPRTERSQNEPVAPASDLRAHSEPADRDERRAVNENGARNGAALAVSVEVFVFTVARPAIEPARDIGVQFGAAWVDAESEESRDTWFARARTDSTGTARCTLELPGEWLAQGGAGDRVKVLARLDEPGFIRRRTSSTVRDPRRDAIDLLMLELEEGATCYGTVLDRAGEPLAGVRIAATRLGQMVGAERPMQAYARSYAGGRFELSVPEVGRYALLARSSGEGAVGLELELGTAPVPDSIPLVIQLAGDGVLAGRVFEATGAPAAGYGLQVMRAEHRALERREVTALCDRMEAAGGLCRDRTSTDDAGAFRFSGLQPGSYVILGTAQGSTSLERCLTPEPVYTGREDLELHARRHLLVVEVRRAGALVRCGRADVTDEGREDMLFAHAVDEHGHVDPGAPEPDQWTELSDGRWAVEVQPSQSYVVGVVSRRAPVVEREVFVGPVDHQVVVTLESEAAGPPGGLEIELQNEDGSLYEGSSELTVHTAESRHRILTRRADTDNELAADFGRVTLAPDHYFVRITDPRRGGGERLPLERLVEVRPEQTTALRLTFARGGWLRFRLLSDASPPPEAGVPPAERVLVFARPVAGGPERQLSVSVGWRVAGLTRSLPQDWLPPGGPYLCPTMLPVGEWVVRAASGSAEFPAQRVTIEPGARPRVDFRVDE